MRARKVGKGKRKGRKLVGFVRVLHSKSKHAEIATAHDSE